MKLNSLLIFGLAMLFAPSLAAVDQPKLTPAELAQMPADPGGASARKQQ